MLTDSQVSAIRSRFKLFEKKIYVNSCSQGALSDVVEAGVLENLRSWHEAGSPWDVWVTKYESARDSFAQLINAKPEEVAVVASASAGMNSVASALRFDQRKKVVMGEFEFPTMGHVWLAQRPRGADIHFLEAAGDCLPIEAYERAVDRDTLIVPLTHICFMNGFRSDIPAITRLAHAQGALVMMDDYQDAGTRPIDVKALDVDFYVTGTLKYLLGPPGMAFLYVKERLIDSLIPSVSGWFAQRNPFAFNPRLFDPSPTARRFEAGTPPVPNVYGAMPALDLLREIGLDHVAAHVGKLAQALLEGARALGITAKTPPSSVGPLTVLRCRDVTAMLGFLAARDIVASSRHDGLRVSFHVYNTMNDVRAVLDVLSQNLNLF